MQIDTSDAVMLGTQDSSEQQGYVSTRYQLRINNNSIMVDVYNLCKTPGFMIVDYECN